MAAKRKAAAGTRTRAPRTKVAERASRGLDPAALRQASPPPAVLDLEERVADAGGVALARYPDPLGQHWLVLASLPLPAVVPTPFQRDLSEAHAKRLADVMHRLDTFLDPVIAVPIPEGHEPPSPEARFWSPNGLHRLTALGRLGARSVTALISPDAALAYRILALNTEKAHSVKERALEAVRMARGLAEVDPQRPETGYALELEEGALVTLGLAYEARPRFAGGAYAPALRQSDALRDEPIGRALERRAAWAERLLAIEDRVAELVEALRARRFESPYLRNFVVARIRPFVPRGREAPGMDDLLGHMARAAEKFDPDKVRGDQIAKAGGGATEE